MLGKNSGVLHPVILILLITSGISCSGGASRFDIKRTSYPPLNQLYLTKSKERTREVIRAFKVCASAAVNSDCEKKALRKLKLSSQLGVSWNYFWVSWKKEALIRTVSESARHLVYRIAQSSAEACKRESFQSFEDALMSSDRDYLLLAEENRNCPQLPLRTGTIQRLLGASSELTTEKSVRIILREANLSPDSNWNDLLKEIPVDSLRRWMLQEIQSHKGQLTWEFLKFLRLKLVKDVYESFEPWMVDLLLEPSTQEGVVRLESVKSLAEFLANANVSVWENKNPEAIEVLVSKLLKLNITDEVTFFNIRKMFKNLQGYVGFPGRLDLYEAWFKKFSGFIMSLGEDKQIRVRDWMESFPYAEDLFFAAERAGAESELKSDDIFGTSSSSRDQFTQLAKLRYSAWAQIDSVSKHEAILRYCDQFKKWGVPFYAEASEVEAKAGCHLLSKNAPLQVKLGSADRDFEMPLHSVLLANGRNVTLRGRAVHASMIDLTPQYRPADLTKLSAADVETLDAIALPIVFCFSNATPEPQLGLKEGKHCSAFHFVLKQAQFANQVQSVELLKGYAGGNLKIISSSDALHPQNIFVSLGSSGQKDARPYGRESLSEISPLNLSEWFELLSLSGDPFFLHTRPRIEWLSRVRKVSKKEVIIPYDYLLPESGVLSASQRIKFMKFCESKLTTSDDAESCFEGKLRKPLENYLSRVLDAGLSNSALVLPKSDESYTEPAALEAQPGYSQYLQGESGELGRLEVSQ